MALVLLGDSQYHHMLSSTIVFHCVLLCAIMCQHLPLFVIRHHRVTSCAIINHYLQLCTLQDHPILSRIIMKTITSIRELLKNNSFLGYPWRKKDTRNKKRLLRVFSKFIGESQVKFEILKSIIHSTVCLYG